jgi:hypothetical protein
MRKELLIIALGLTLANGLAMADVLATPEENQTATAAPATLPPKGISMVSVEKKFGAPREKHSPRGGDSPKHPPITRWDYDGFAVFFEHDKVIDAVIPGRPPRVYNKDQLTPVAASAAPPPPVVPTAEIAPPPAEMSPPATEEPVVPEAEAAEPAATPAEAAAAPAPAESYEPAAEAAASEPAASEPPPPATTPPASSYPDRPPGQTPAEEIPDQPPTPK